MMMVLKDAELWILLLWVLKVILLSLVFSRLLGRRFCVFFLILGVLGVLREYFKPGFLVFRLCKTTRKLPGNIFRVLQQHIV
jgi:hypothetical protein